MKSIDQVRLDNLMLLPDEAGTVEAVAERAGTSAVYLSQLRNRTIDSSSGRPREMGSRLARRLEVAFNRNKGWMDEVHYRPGAHQVPHVIRQVGTDVGPLNNREVDAILALRALSQKARDQFITELMKAAEDAQQFTAEVLARQGVTGRVSDARAAEVLPDHPEGRQRDSAHGVLG